MRHRVAYPINHITLLGYPIIHIDILGNRRRGGSCWFSPLVSSGLLRLRSRHEVIEQAGLGALAGLHRNSVGIFCAGFLTVGLDTGTF